MTIEEAIFCEKAYIGETNCTDCKYYGTVPMAYENAFTCRSGESHKLAVKALKVLEQTRWIPVSERLPKSDEEYHTFLVTDNKGQVKLSEFYLSLLDKKALLEWND